MNRISAASPSFNGKAPHLMCTREDIAEIVLLPGNPDRVEIFKQLFDDFEIVSRNREYTVGTGTYQGVRISVCSTGIGAPSTEIAVVELIELGAKALVRVGGTGAIQPDIPCGGIIINTAAVRQGGASQFYAPPEFPAVASVEAVQCLVEACEGQGQPVWKGICASVGSFFAGQGRPVLGNHYHSERLLEDYKKLGILNLEMEAETIFTLGSLFDVYTGSICAVHCNRDTDEWMLDFEQAQMDLCKTAMDGVVLLHKKYLAGGNTNEKH